MQVVAVHNVALNQLHRASHPSDYEIAGPKAADNAALQRYRGKGQQKVTVEHVHVHAGGRCRLHGGKSTGPRTAEELERCRTANWKHGRYSREACAERRGMRDLLKDCGKLLSDLRRPV